MLVTKDPENSFFSSDVFFIAFLGVENLPLRYGESSITTSYFRPGGILYSRVKSDSRRVLNLF